MLTGVSGWMCSVSAGVLAWVCSLLAGVSDWMCSVYWCFRLGV